MKDIITNATNTTKEGDIAPEFELLDDRGNQVRLSDYRGETVILYFYPMDKTPGCTTEAINIRDAWKEFVDRDVAVLGISTDDVESHRDFKECYQLPFKLLADPEHVVCERYGTQGAGNMATRTTFLIDETGRVLKIWTLVDPAEHARWLLDEIDRQYAHT